MEWNHSDTFTVNTNVVERIMRILSRNRSGQCPVVMTTTQPADYLYPKTDGKDWANSGTGNFVATDARTY